MLSPVEPIQTVELKTVNSVRPSVPLEFKVVPCRNKQARFGGRVLLEPKIDLNDYKCRAVIDWLEVEIQLGRRTQHQWVQKPLEDSYGRRCWIEAVNPGQGNTTDRFIVRFQEPTIARVCAALGSLTKNHSLVGASTVTGIEVSLDFTPRVHSEEARARMVGVLQRSICPQSDFLTEPKDRPRFNHKQGGEPTFLFPKPRISDDDKYSWTRSERDQQTPVDATLSIGRKEGRVMYRIMDKVVDQQNRTTGAYRGAPMRLRSPWMSSGRSRDISRCLKQGEFNWNDRSIYRLSTYRALLAA